MARKKTKKNPKERIRTLHVTIEECEQIIDKVLGDPRRPVQKYLRATRKRDRAKNKLKWVELWHGK